MDKPSNSLYWNEYNINKNARQMLNGHRSFTVWFTGLSASGKSTLAQALERVLFDRGAKTYVLDGDNIRHGLNSNLGFSNEDRKENIRRVGEVAKLFVDAGVITIVALISPFRSERDAVRARFEKGEFFEVYVECPLDVCEQRDPKGLYSKARKGEVKEFTGISSPYEEPLHPEIKVNTNEMSVNQAIDAILLMIEDHKEV